jgi:AcrR family transcriptional regulator
VDSTRDRLLDAAEALFAAQGVRGVSLREIVRAAGARNASALQYHFGNRAGMVRAVLQRHTAEIEARRHALLDACEPRPELRPLVAALVLPLSAKLTDPSGRDYLRIHGEVANRPHPEIHEDDLDPVASIVRWRTMIEPLLDADAIRLHRRHTVARFVTVELARRADAAHTDDRLFVSHLIDLTAALLRAPLSTETLDLEATRR